MRIAVANSKGGVGKSTIANVIAQRLNLPIKNGDYFQDPFLFTDAKKYKGGGSYVLDAGGFVGKELEEELRKADLVVVPLKASPRDLMATVAFLEWLLRFYTKKVLITANMADEKRAEELRDAIGEALEGFERIEAEDVRFTRLPELRSLQKWDLEQKRWGEGFESWSAGERKAAEHVMKFCEAMEAWLDEDINE